MVLGAAQQDDLKYIILPGRMDGSVPVEIHNAAFEVWHKVWKAAYQELDGNDTLFSDDFSRQTDIGGVFLKDRCIALTTFRRSNFEYKAARHDTYFRCWPESAIDALLRDGKKVLVAAHTTVDPEFRGDIGGGVYLKEVIVQMCVKRFYKTDCDVMTATTRRNRGITRVAIEAGVEEIQRDLKLHGVDIDLAAWYRSTAESRIQKRIPLVENMWRNHIDLTETGVQSTPVRRVA